MKINEINTPAILLNLDYMEHNLKKYCGEAKKYGKEIWPMVKTHKSTELARLQAEYGCSGYLCGTPVSYTHLDVYKRQSLSTLEDNNTPNIAESTSL